MIIAGFDPGTRNFGYSIVDLKRKIIKFGHLDKTIKKGDTIHLVKDEYVKEFKNLLKVNKVDFFTIERYQARVKTGNIELVNLMIGYTFSYKKVYYITPSEWKRKLNKIQEDLYKIYSNILTPHQIDSLCIALYGYYYKYKGDDKNIFKILNMLRKRKHWFIRVGETK